MSTTHQDLSNDTTFSQIKSRVPVPLRKLFLLILDIDKPQISRDSPINYFDLIAGQTPYILTDLGQLF